MSPANRFRHQAYRSARPTSPYHLLPAVSSVDPQTVEFGEQLAVAGASFDRAQVAAIYCVHGTFVGNDVLGLLTELSRFAPGLSQSLSRCGKRLVDLVTGEAGNYTREFTDVLETGLAVGAERTMPVRLFHWSSENNHIARADGAIKLIAELARLASELDSSKMDAARPSRVMLWAHSHGGNVLALTTQLLGADREARDEFFEAARCFYQPWLRQTPDMPVWQHVRALLDDASHPLRQLALDVVTFGTPVRYGWNRLGYANLLHFIHHRPPPRGPEYSAPVPLNLMRARKAMDGDYVQQLGISGTNCMPLPLAPRTLLADWRLDTYLEHDVAFEWIFTRLGHGKRVPDEGTTLLVDYQGIHPRVYRHLAGHGLYTRRKWLPFHCREIAARFYDAQ